MYLALQIGNGQDSIHGNLGHLLLKSEKNKKRLTSVFVSQRLAVGVWSWYLVGLALHQSEHLLIILEPRVVSAVFNKADVSSAVHST